MVSELPGRNESERTSSLETGNPEAEPFPLRRRQQGSPSPGQGDPSGGVSAAARRQGRAKQLVKPVSPRRESDGARYIAQPTISGGDEGERVEDGPEAARKRGNARGAMGPCCTYSFCGREAGAE
jgi:hypothetical protein